MPATEREIFLSLNVRIGVSFAAWRKSLRGDRVVDSWGETGNTLTAVPVSIKKVLALEE